MEEVIHISNYFKFMQELSRKIKERHTGSHSEFAEALGISEDKLSVFLELIANSGEIITYSKNENTYHFSDGTIIGKVKKTGKSIESLN